MISTKYSRNKLIIFASYSSLVLFVLLLITKIFLPNAGGGWSKPPIFDYIYLFGIGICFSILGIGYTYYSWTLKAKEYSEWAAVQQNNFESWLERTDSIFPTDSTLLWSSRIAGPFWALIGIAISVLMLVSIFYYLFGKTSH
jgi:hypothetical protein